MPARRCDVCFTGSSLSLCSTVLTAFDQLRDSQRHPDDVKLRPVPSRRCAASPRRAAASEPHSGDDDDQSCALPSSTMSSSPMNDADDGQKCLTVDPPSPVRPSPSSSSSSSSEVQHPLSTPHLLTPTTTPVAGDFVPTSDVNTGSGCRLRRDSSSDDCRSMTPSPPISFCAAVTPAGGVRCVGVQLASNKTSRAVAEIIDTERKYVHDLKQIVHVRLHPFVFIHSFLVCPVVISCQNCLVVCGVKPAIELKLASKVD